MGIKLKFKNQTLKEMIKDKIHVCKIDHAVVDKIYTLPYRFKVYVNRFYCKLTYTHVSYEMVYYLIILTGMWSKMLYHISGNCRDDLIFTTSFKSHK